MLSRQKIGPRDNRGGARREQVRASRRGRVRKNECEHSFFVFIKIVLPPDVLYCVISCLLDGEARHAASILRANSEGAQRRAAAVPLRGRAAPEQGELPKAERVNPLDAREQRLEDGASWGATARARNSEPPARARSARARRAAEGRASQPQPPLPTRATERRLEDGGQGNLFLYPLLSF